MKVWFSVLVVVVGVALGVGSALFKQRVKGLRCM